VPPPLALLFLALMLLLAANFASSADVLPLLAPLLLLSFSPFVAVFAGTSILLLLTSCYCWRPHPYVNSFTSVLEFLLLLACLGIFVRCFCFIRIFLSNIKQIEANIVNK
jgi:hypothetical protein